MQNSINKQLVILIFVFGVINSLFFMYGHRLVVDSMQLIERGYMFTQGNLIPFGPRSTHSNMIYGSLVSVLSGIGLFLTNGPTGIMIIILLFQSLAFYFLYKTRFLNINNSFLYIYLFLFWCSPWRASEVFIWNASLLFFTSSLFFYSIDLFKREKTMLGTLLHGLSYILSFQIHNSVIIFAPITIYFLIKKEIKFNLKAFLICVLIFALMLFPTAYVLYKHPEILEYNRSGKAHLFANLVNFAEMIKGFTYWVRYPSLYFGSTTLSLPKIAFGDRDLLEQIWFCIKWILAVSSVIFVLVINIKYFKKMPAFLKRLCWIALMSLFLISAMSPVPFNFWHLYLIYPFTLIPVTFYLCGLQKKRRVFVSLAIYFFIYSFIGGYYSYKHDFKTNKQLDYKTKILDHRESLINKYKNLFFKINL